uniref:Uncharacterized protein n=1 Tax=Romanomermis culicivorax TaxID=13658 RepID=A0A915J062_ROMCU
MTPPESPERPLLGARASISSKNITHGLHRRALVNSSRTFCSDWPTYMFKSSGPLTLKNYELPDLLNPQAKTVG